MIDSVGRVNRKREGREDDQTRKKRIYLVEELTVFQEREKEREEERKRLLAMKTT